MKRLALLGYMLLGLGAFSTLSAQILTEGFEEANLADINNLITRPSSPGDYTFMGTSTDNPFSGTRSLKLTNGGTTQDDGVGLMLPFSQPSTISFAIRCSNVNNFMAFVTPADLSSPAGIINTSKMVSVYFAVGSLVVQHGSGTHSMPATNDTWYEIDIENIDWTNKTYSIRVNGFLLTSNRTFISPNINKINYLALYNSSATGDAYWDDISVDGLLLNQPPVASCQDITLQLDSTGQASMNFLDIDDGSMDPEGNPLTYGLIQGKFFYNCFDVNNATLNKMVVTDAEGLKDTCEAIVTVQDTIAPTALCQDRTITLNPSTLQADITTADINFGSSDNCSIASTVLSMTQFDSSDVGPNTVMLTVEDFSGNTGFCNSTVTVQMPNLNPIAVCKDTTLFLDANGEAILSASDIDGGSNDPDGDPITLAVSQALFNCADTGVNAVTLIVNNIARGMSSTCTANVTVVDNMAPTAMCQDLVITLDSTGVANISAQDIDNGSSDNCGIASMSLSQTQFDTTNLGNTTVILSVTDVSGNVATCFANVHVDELTNNQPPVMMCQDVTLELDENGEASLTAADVDAGSFDPDAGDSLSFSISRTQFACFDLDVSPITVFLNAIDQGGLSNSCSSLVTIVDNLAPIIDSSASSVPPLMDTVFADADGNFSMDDIAENVTATDNCGTIATIEQSPTQGTILGVGSHTVTITVTDASGNQSTYVYTLVVEEVVSVQEIALNSMAIYPTPVQDKLTITNPYAVSIETITLLDLSGRMVYHRPVNQTNTKQVIDLSQLPQGAYILRIQSEAGQVAKRLMKQ